MNTDAVYLNILSNNPVEISTSGDMSPASVSSKLNNHNRKLKIDLESLHETIQGLFDILDEIKNTNHDKKIIIDTVKINLGVSAGGQVGLLGTGVEFQTEANIELNLKYS